MSKNNIGDFMYILKSLWKFSYKTGLSLFLITIMFIGAVSLVSLTQKGKVYYGNRCNASINKKALAYLNQDEVISYDYELNCNTLYLDLTLENSITKENAKSLLVRISSYYKSINYNVDTQITLKGNDYMILASLVANEITMSITQL